MSIILLPRLGAAALVVFVVAGQMLTSMTFDHYGLVGLAKQRPTPLYLVGALLVAGVVLIRLPGKPPADSVLVPPTIPE